MSILKISFLAFTLVLGACSSDNAPQEKSKISVSQAQLSETQKKLNELNQANVLNQLFSASPEQDLRLFEQAISKAQSGVQILQKFDGDKKQAELAYADFSTAIYLIDSFNLLQFNEDRVNRVFNDIREMKTQLSLDLGLPIETWVLYKNNFADGIGPEFRAPPGKDQYGEVSWATNFQIDTPKAKVQARDGYAWMVSRAFDISQVEQPSFRFHASYLVSSRDAELSLYEVVRRVFKTYVILDLKPDESLEDIPNDRKILMEYDVDEIPKARDFHDAWLPKRSLEPYRNHTVSIAFLFDTREIKYKQFYGWDIFDFELIGAGSLHVSPYLEQPNLGELLGGYQSLTQIFSGNEWRSGENKVYANSNPELNTDVVLLSPLYSFSKKVYQNSRSLTLHIEEEFFNTSLDQAQVLISTDYKVGDAFDTNKQNWQTLNRSQALGEKQSFDLTPYADQDIVLAFRFQSDTEKRSWDLNSITLESEGASITAIPFVSLDANNFVNTYKTFDILTDNYRDYQKQYASENSPEWKKRKDGVAISGFQGVGEPTLDDVSRLVTPEVKLLAGNSIVRFEHSLGFYKGHGPLKFQIKKVCGEQAADVLEENPTPELDNGDNDPSNQPAEEPKPRPVFDPCNDWFDLPVPTSNFRDIEEPEFSTWIAVPESYRGTTVQLAFFYKAQGKNSPNWSVRKIQVASPDGAQ